MLDAFNREFDDPTPGPDFLEARIAELIDAGAAIVIVVGEGPDGVSVLRVRPAIWSGANEAYLAELYVVPERRGRGLGRALLEATLDAARDAGCDHIDLGTGETDTAARALYERLGFSNTEGRDGPVMLWYEREL